MGVTGTERGDDPARALCQQPCRAAGQLSCHEPPADRASEGLGKEAVNVTAGKQVAAGGLGGLSCSLAATPADGRAASWLGRLLQPREPSPAFHF